METDKTKQKELKKEEKEYRRHKRIWWFCRHFVGPFIMNKYGCKCTVTEKLPEPFLLVANHSTDLDPGIIGMCSRQQMYFVASEHLYRLGFLSKILIWAFKPIAKMKGSSDTLTVMKAIRYLRNGKNVSLFPDGNRSFNGRNGALTDAIGKLVKTSGANLVTFRITGGFFTNPRWGYGLRKGKMTAQVVNVYSKEKIKEMSAGQIREIIEKDTYENAYERQASENIRYKGKNRAVGMECSLCICPKCKGIETIYTKENSVNCVNCGKLTDYSEYGYFDEGFDFKTIEEWDDWQEQYFKDYIQTLKDGKGPEGVGTEKPVFSNSDINMNIVKADHSETDLGKGSLSIYLDKIVIKTNVQTIEIPFTELPDMSVYAKTGLVFTDAAGTHYELKTDKLINVRKYIYVWSSLRQKE